MALPVLPLLVRFFVLASATLILYTIFSDGGLNPADIFTYHPVFMTLGGVVLLPMGIIVFVSSMGSGVGCLSPRGAVKWRH